jgi:putative oxidoreductase
LILLYFTLNCAILLLQNKTSREEKSLVKSILFGGESGLSYAANAGLTLLRIFAGISLAFAHGIGKLPPSQQFIDGATRLGFPAPTFFAWAAALSESFGGILLALGLFTRISSFLIACVMLTALLGVHFSDPFDRQEKAFLYLFIDLALLLKGSGDWRIDSYLRK